MNPVTYTGNGTTQSITNVNFQPGFVWVKERSGANSHMLCDVVRGVTKILFSNLNNLEDTDANSITAFGSDGFSVGSSGNVNANNDTYVSWNWKAGGSASSNTDGTITSSVSANTTSGFSALTYSANNTAGATVGHGLGSVPEMIMVKEKSGSINDWTVYHATQGNTTRGVLNETNVWGSNAAWNNTTPTSSVFTIGSGSNVNRSGSTYAAYCFTGVKGFSKFGSYVGNGNADGTFIYTGFKPAYFVIKRTDATENWYCTDIKRNPINPVDNELLLLNSDTATITTSYPVDFLSNGFKIRGNNNITNASGGTYIYMAFAENPLVANTSGGIPTTAR